ncbi:hypothetical protein ACPWSR_08200 [Alloiococcus sp. CFN-8]|uniref:hypothetical protein n=1 Tax=Alloiococcus sp. CFN-8 TaxID=3416081 RepID=UPI003CE85E65
MRKITVSLLIITLISLIVSACGLGDAPPGEEAYEAEEVSNFDDINFSVYAGKASEKVSRIDCQYYPRNFGSGEDTKEAIDYDALDEYYMNLIFNEEIDSLFITLNYMPENMHIIKVDDKGKESKVDYRVERELAPEGEKGYVYTFAFDFTFGEDFNPVYKATITYPEEKILDLAFKIRNPEQKPLTKEAIDINLSLEKEEEDKLYHFLLNTSVSYGIHSNYIRNSYIHVEEMETSLPDIVRLFAIMIDDNGYLGYGYIFKNSIEEIYGDPTIEPTAFDIDKDGQMELIYITNWGSGNSSDFIYVFDNEEERATMALYGNLWLQIPKDQGGEHYQVIYQGDAPATKPELRENTGTVQLRVNSQGEREVYIEKAEEDKYTDMEAHRAK